MEMKLLISGRKILKRIVEGIKLEYGTWRRRLNKEVSEAFNITTVVHVIKAQHLRWLSLVIRMPFQKMKPKNC